MNLIGSVVVMVNAVIFGYKNVRILLSKPFTIPVWVFFYLILSLLFLLFLETLGATYFGISQTAPGAAAGNAFLVSLILTDPAQWSQHVRGRESWQRFLRKERTN